MPTWVGGAGALAAGWFAYQTIRSQRQQIGEQRVFIAEQTRFMGEQRQNLELERAELRAQAEERRRAQSRLIKMVFFLYGNGDSVSPDEPYTSWRVRVVNGSGEPIRDVLVRFGDAYNAVSATDHEAANHPDRGRRPVPVPEIAAGRTVDFASPDWPEATVDNNRPALLFTDDGGVRWRLDSYGKLEEAPADRAS
ncbi:hypothetical protein ACIRFH_35285 [Streptomyces sp. NPDC093586]|uniref:hypothetical protein n=1 Tax=Streptomyces sp. NPDC093586 TaxID=3366042 RepID=UPI0038170542